MKKNLSKFVGCASILASSFVSPARAGSPNDFDILKTPVGVAVKQGVDSNQPCVALVYKGPDYESCIISAQQRNGKNGGDTGPYDLGLYFDAWFTMDTLARPDEPATIDFLKEAGAAAKPVATRFFKRYREVQRKVGVTDEQLIALYQLNEPQQLKVRIAAAARETGG